MSFSQLFIDDDFENVVDDLELVTLRQKGIDLPVTYTDHTNITALRRALRRSEKAAKPPGTLMSVVTIRWHLNSSDLEVIPRYQDQIVDADGVTYIIERVEVVTNQSRYQCDCFRSTEVDT